MLHRKYVGKSLSNEIVLGDKFHESGIKQQIVYTAVTKPTKPIPKSRTYFDSGISSS
jgi:hypothetical protein